MNKEDVVNYLNGTLERNHYTETDVLMIRNFINIKHNKLLHMEEIRHSMMRRMDMPQLMGNFCKSLSQHFEITEVYKDNRLIKYHAV